jgi:hypothetical protein
MPLKIESETGFLTRLIYLNVKKGERSFIMYLEDIQIAMGRIAAVLRRNA